MTAFTDKFEFLPQRIPDDAVGFTAPPIVGDESWLYRFETTGVYDIACLPHITFGMVVRVVVLDPKSDDPSELETAGPLGAPPLQNANLVLTTPELDPGNIVEEGTVAWADLSLDEQV